MRLVLSAVLGLSAAGPLGSVARADVPVSSIEEIVVTAGPSPRARLELVAATSVLSGVALSDALRGSLGETLAGQPGVSSTFFGPVASRPIIRGYDGDRVRVQHAGLGVVDVSSISPDHQVAQDLETARRVEVVRGPGTLMYGTGLIGGVVDIDDGRVTTVAPQGGLDGLLTASYASNARNVRTAGRLDAAVNARLLIHADAALSDQGDYRVRGFSGPDSKAAGIMKRVPNSAAEAKHGGAGATVLLDNGYIGVGYGRFDSDYQSPAEPGLFAEEPGEDPAAVRLAVDQSRYELRAGLNDLGGLIDRLSLRASAGDYEHVEFEGDEQGTVFANEGREARVDAYHGARGNLSGVFGLQWRERDFSALGAEAFVPPTKTTQWAPFLVEDFASGRWSAQAGVRLERTRIKNPSAAARRAFTSPATSLSAAYEAIDGFYIGAGASWSQRPPSAEELFSDGPHLATAQFEVGDSELDEEETRHGELSFKMNRGPVTLALNVFRSTHDGFIFAAETGAVEDGLPVFQFTAVDARFHGGELEASWTLINGDDWRAALDGALEVVRAKDTLNNRTLPRIAPLGYRFGVDVSRGMASARLEVEGAADQSRIAPGETATASYAFLNAQIALTPFGADGARLVLQGRNLTNAKARPHTSFIKDDAPLPGRDIRLSVRREF
jgi:iron complex outermembrane receptor protein